VKSDPYAVTDAIFWGEMVQQAYDMYEKSAAGTLTPPIPAQPGLPEGWELICYLVVRDQVLFFKANASFGYILFNSAQNAYGIVIRGTDGTLEWIEDVEAILAGFLVKTKIYGNVESGFLREFQNLRVYAPTTQDLGPLPNWLATLPPAASVVVAGHSLGAAVATIVGAQTAIQGLTTRIYSFASPQVGDSHFAALFDNLSLDHYRIYNIHDLVPKVPSPTLGYYAVDTAIEIDSDNGKVKTNVTCCHSLRTYLAILGSVNYAVDPVCLVPVTMPAS
jgi:triacylglycerol lipase